MNFKSHKLRCARLMTACLLGVPLAASAYDLIELGAPLVPAEVTRPVAVSASAERLYVLDGKKNALYILDNAGNVIKAVGRYGRDPGEFSYPRGVAVSPNGEVLVADTGNSRVEIFDAAGTFLSAFGVKGSAPGRLSGPRSVAVGIDGRVYVSDTDNDRMQVFTKEGVFLFGFGTKGKLPGQFKSPGRLAVDASDDIYVLDEGNDRVQKFDLRTRPIGQFEVPGVDFDVDEYGFLYVLDHKRGKVSEVSPEGVILGSFGTWGSGHGQFKKPEGIAISPDGEILVADTANGRIQRVRVSNKLKVNRLPGNLATKLLVSGPTRVMRASASALAAEGKDLYAYLPKYGQFAVFGPDGRESRRFGKKTGKDEGVTRYAGGLAASSKYGVYVADAGDDKMQAFDAAGAFKLNFAQTRGLFASKKVEGRVKQPGGVAINDKGTIYVADTGNRRVQAFSPDGTFLFSFGPKIGPHELAQPVALAWDDEGFIYVLDRKLKKVFKCEPSGGFVLAWGEPGQDPGRFMDPVSIAYDGRSYIYVLDKGLRRVSVFNRVGNWVTDFFARGDDERSLEDPAALAVLGDELVVSDPAHQRIASFALHPRLAPPLSISTRAAEGQVSLQWEATNDPWVSSYRVMRSTLPGGPYAEMARAKTSSVKDNKVEAYQRYYYRVAVEAQTGDVGPYSRPAMVFVPGEFNRAPVEIAAASVGDIFPARYKWYLKNPLGSAVVSNNVDVPFQNVKLSFRLKDFMDFPTEKIIDVLDARQRVEVPLLATLNNHILDITEDTPIQAELTLTYFEKGKEQVVSRAMPLKVYSRNAITWDDPRRIVSFITPNDPPVLDWGREALRQAPKGPVGSQYLNANLVTALHLWDALGAMGVKFLASPNNPFEKISEDPAFPVDYTQFPRETLRRKSGQCDDLATLIASLLEGSGVRAALLDYPGHVALMFDTGSNDPVEVGLPEDQMIRYQGELWVPIEPTMVGSPFDDASRKALFAYQEMYQQGKANIIDARDVVGTYDPATLPPSDQSIEAPEQADCEKRFHSAAAGYLKTRYEFLRSHFNEMLAKNEGDVDIMNQLGLLYSQQGKYSDAEKEFNRALESEPKNSALLNNLGNLAYLKGKYEAASAYYEKASQSDPKDTGIWMNRARAALALDRRAQAEEFTQKAVRLDPELKPDAETLLK